MKKIALIILISTTGTLAQAQTKASFGVKSRSLISGSIPEAVLRLKGKNDANLRFDLRVGTIQNESGKVEFPESYSDMPKEFLKSFDKNFDFDLKVGLEFNRKHFLLNFYHGPFLGVGYDLEYFNRITVAWEGSASRNEVRTLSKTLSPGYRLGLTWKPHPRLTISAESSLQVNLGLKSHTSKFQFTSINSGVRETSGSESSSSSSILGATPSFLSFIIAYQFKKGN